MPFTPSHIVAILPITRFTRRFPFSALAIGSMIPDLPLFFPIASYWQTHDFSKVLTLCLPLGLTAFVLFQMFLKAPIVSLLPRYVQERIAPYLSGQLTVSPRYWLFVVVGIVIGAYSHIFWDSFTHVDRWGTQTFPALNGVVSIGTREIPIYRLLQHTSSIAGLLILAVIGLGLLSQDKIAERSSPSNVHSSIKWLAAFFVVVVPLMTMAYVSRFDYSTTDIVGLTVRFSIALLGLMLGFYSLCFHLVTGYRFVER